MDGRIAVCFGPIRMGNGVFSIWEGGIPMLISLSQISQNEKAKITSDQREGLRRGIMSQEMISFQMKYLNSQGEFTCFYIFPSSLLIQISPKKLYNTGASNCSCQKYSVKTKIESVDEICKNVATPYTRVTP
jgi:hypothetical protein